MTRRDRALRHFRSSILGIIQTAAPATLHPLASLITDEVEEASEASDLWERVRPQYEHELRKIRRGSGTLAHVVEWELLKLQARIKPEPQTGWPTLFRDKHVHIGSLASTTLDEKGGPFFDAFMPLYKARLAAEELVVPEEWQYRNPKWDTVGRLLEISHTYYFPHHTYDRRTFVKVRLSREFETYEEIMVWDFLDLLARLYQTTDWAAYRQDTKDVDIRFDLQDFVSLNHITEGVYQRTEKEERLLQELKEAFRGSIRERPVLYQYLDRVIKSKWIENFYWAIAGAVLGIRKFERPVNYGHEILTLPLPPQLLIPVKRHVQAYHERVGALRPESS